MIRPEKMVRDWSRSAFLYRRSDLVFGAWWIWSVLWSYSRAPVAIVRARLSAKPPGAWRWLSDSWRACLAPRWTLSDCTRASRRTMVELNWSERASRDQTWAAA